jgi:hypothetical protein
VVLEKGNRARSCNIHAYYSFTNPKFHWTVEVIWMRLHIFNHSGVFGLSRLAINLHVEIVNIEFGVN